MFAIISHVWHNIKTSFWFIPGLMVFSAVALALVFQGLDRSLDLAASGLFPIITRIGPEGARAVVSTIAGSMISIAGLTFSIVIVVLTLASSQFGSRLLKNFMMQKGNQFTLGTFISTFIYCLLVLRAIRGVEGEFYVPYVSVAFAVILALGNVIVLIYFIHHTASSIQVDNLIASVYEGLVQGIERIFPREIGNAQEARGVSVSQVYLDGYARTEYIGAQKSGYLLVADLDTLLDIAQEADLVLAMHNRPGEFLTRGSKIITLKAKGAVDEDIPERIRDCFIIGKHRTEEQDIEFPVCQLVEIAARALSPGVNDPYTAISCVNYLSAALCHLANKEFPAKWLFDENNKPRIETKAVTFTGVANAAFDQIRQYARSDAAVTIKLLEALTVIAGQARLPEHAKALGRQALMILNGSREGLPDPEDRQDVENRYMKFRQALSDNPNLSFEAGKA